jgi:hypothetical protein
MCCCVQHCSELTWLRGRTVWSPISSPRGAKTVRKVDATNTPPGFSTRLISAMAACGLGLQLIEREQIDRICHLNTSAAASDSFENLITISSTVTFRVRTCKCVWESQNRVHSTVLAKLGWSLHEREPCYDWVDSSLSGKTHQQWMAAPA